MKTILNKPIASLKDAWIALTGLSTVFLFEMLDNSILNVALPTIGRELNASVTSLQWITSSYAVVFGGLLILFGSLADKFGPRRFMLIGLAMLATSSFLTLFVHTPGELIAVRILIGIAAAMTTPLSFSLAFRLFQDDSLRIRAISLISTVGLVGLAVGPTTGGFLLAVAPWQALLLVNVPIAVLAFISVHFGIAADKTEDLHDTPLDIAGAALGTLTIILFLISPTLFVENGVESILPWLVSIATVIFATLFIIREKTAKYPLIDIALVGQPLVASGLAYKAATGISLAALGYFTSLQLQLAWGWSPAQAAIGMLPQVITLLATGPFIGKFVKKIGTHKAILIGAIGVVAGLVVFGTLGQSMYIGIAIALIISSAGLRVVGVVAGVNVLNGVPMNRRTMGSAMVDTADEVASAIGVAVAGTVLASIFVGTLSKGNWNNDQAAQFHSAVFISCMILAIVASGLIGWAIVRTRKITVAMN